MSFQRYDLPPTSIAQPLPVLKTNNAGENGKSNHVESSRHVRRKSRVLKKEDDTPRAFTRLMNLQKGWKPPWGLDDDAPASRKRKRSNIHNQDQSSDHNSKNTPPTSIPKILPSERLSDFSARVNAAIPVAGLAKKSKRGSELLKGERQTKLEKRMQKMYAEWREADAKRKERLAEEEDEFEMEEDEVGKERSTLPASTKTKKVKGKRRKGLMMNDGNEAPNDDDPWSHIAAKRKENTIVSSSPGGLAGLHDVVLAPPKLSKLPKEKMRDKTGQNAPKKAAIIGRKRQEELGEVRRQVVEGYRRMMSERRGEQ